jgi:hypothetical protein
MRQGALCAMLGAVLVLVLGGAASAQSLNGAAGQMPAFYDCEQFTVNLKPVSLDPSHSQVNIIYFLSNGTMVLDQITGGEVPTAPKSGFNPLWLGIDVTINDTSLSSTLCSDDAIVAASKTGGVSLMSTGQVFRCSVVGKK